MTTTHSTDPAPARVKARGFVAATISFVAVFAAGATPIPLYDTYRTENGLTNDEFSLVAVAYFACAVFALLVLGRLSNHHGRRPVAIAALLLAVAGCITLLFVHSLPAGCPVLGNVPCLGAFLRRLYLLRLGAILGGAFAPTIAAALVPATGGTDAVSLYLVGMTLISLLAVSLVRDRSGMNLSIHNQAEQEVGALIFDRRTADVSDEPLRTN
jgi:MFS family permease